MGQNLNLLFSGQNSKFWKTFKIKVFKQGFIFFVLDFHSRKVIFQKARADVDDAGEDDAQPVIKSLERIREIVAKRRRRLAPIIVNYACLLYTSPSPRD